MSQTIAALCPRCGATLTVWIDDASGPPSEVGTECTCGAIPVFAVTCEPTYYLGAYQYDDRAGAGPVESDPA